MKYEGYSGVSVNDDLSVFDFISIGKNGAIPKRIEFVQTEWDNVYNLAFGDIDVDGEMDDHSVSDNGDRNKILATIANAIEKYTKRYPLRWILFKGSTDERTRLYRMAIGLNIVELAARFEIYAYVEDNLVLFVKNLKVNAFLIKRKKV